MRPSKGFEEYWEQAAPAKLGEWTQFDREAVKDVAWAAWQAAIRTKRRG